MKTQTATAYGQHTEAFYAEVLADPKKDKRCPSCGETKRMAGFSKERARSDGFKSTCKECCRIADTGRPERAFGRHALRLKDYGLTVEQYNMLLEAQNGVCAICGEPPKETRLAVDHCHEGGHVRGLLCRRCNQALGLMKDDARIANKAVDYLLRF